MIHHKVAREGWFRSMLTHKGGRNLGYVSSIGLVTGTSFEGREKRSTPMTFADKQKKAISFVLTWVCPSEKS